MSDFTTSNESIGLRPVSQIVARPISWLWPGRLPLGKLAILDGDPGVGKSLVTLDLCARLSTGRPVLRRAQRSSVTKDFPTPGSPSRMANLPKGRRPGHSQEMGRATI